MAIDHDVLVLGGAGVDTVVYVPSLPLPFTDSYLVPAIETRAGQTGGGVALGLHALGLRVHHMDALGNDHEGSLVRDLHARHGVPFTAVPSTAGTKRAVNLVDPAGHRLCLLLVGGDDALRHVPASPLSGPAVDSNGAGDAFVSRFLFGFLSGDSPSRSALYAAIAGAHARTVSSSSVDPIDRQALLARAA